ncbi:MAG: hypothetical protein O7C69_01095 [Gammaproteobacteria bacterium]|nr:hypothetical protein [Gammaproteobacteria bacterium]
MRNIKLSSRHNLRRIVISLLIVILAALSPNIAAASPETDREFTNRLIYRNSAIQDRIDSMRKQMIEAVRSKGMQLSGGVSTNRLADTTVGRYDRIGDHTQSRLPDTGIRSRQSAADTRLQERIRANNRATKDRDFERVKGMLDTLENRLRGNRRELRKYAAAHLDQSGGSASVRKAGQISDRHLIAMEHEVARIEEEVSNYVAKTAKGAR